MGGCKPTTNNRVQLNLHFIVGFKHLRSQMTVRDLHKRTSERYLKIGMYRSQKDLKIFVYKYMVELG